MGISILGSCQVLPRSAKRQSEGSRNSHTTRPSPKRFSAPDIQLIAGYHGFWLVSSPFLVKYHAQATVTNRIPLKEVNVQ